MRKFFIHPDCRFHTEPLDTAMVHPGLCEVITFVSDPYPEHDPICQGVTKGFVYYLN